MSRRRKSSRSRRPAAIAGERDEQQGMLRPSAEASPNNARPAIRPNPPRPRKILLLAAGAALAAWIAFLITLVCGLW